MELPGALRWAQDFLRLVNVLSHAPRHPKSDLAPAATHSLAHPII